MLLSTFARRYGHLHNGFKQSAIYIWLNSVSLFALVFFVILCEGGFIIILTLMSVWCHVTIHNYLARHCDVTDQPDSAGTPLLIERFRNPTITITDTITVSEQPHVTSSLSVFVNANSVESCFEKRVQLVQFLGELLEFKLN